MHFIYQSSIRTNHVPAHQSYDKDQDYNNRQGKLYSGSESIVSYAGRDWGQEEKGTTQDEMAGWHHGLDGCESE